ncbi:spore coat protein YsxE [Halalkalibacter urbisdiaboli]|uniref:spore coat protein YsxE n=1 Tax=Halalkalibacter urbisdiaboli TaxID=1960589 RepID=UPI000B446B27|nr:spore coat protein YsxE [Halalkalibacter urbisdiaboli]
MNRETEQLYRSLLFYYDLYLERVEDYGKIKKVSTNRGEYALKESTMSPVQADEFIQALRKLTKMGYKQAVPILPTKYGEYTITTQSHTYYLMPWVEQFDYLGRESQEEKLANQLGIIHRMTVNVQPFSKDQVEQSYQQLLLQWERKQLELNRFADQAERKTYMSPFELTFLTHSHMLQQMAESAKNHLQAWYNTCVDKEKYRSVLCHGKLSRKHAVFTGEHEPLILNFERACLDTPARDIASFCRLSFPYAYWSEEEVLRWFMRYESHLPLLNEEKQLLCGYLNFPDPVVFAVESYVNNRKTMSELQHVQRLEKRLMTLRRVQRLTQKLIAQETEQS